MPDRLLVVGAGGFGRETIDVADAMTDVAGAPRWEVVGVADDSPSELNLARLATRGITYLGTLDKALASVKGAQYVIGIGSPSVRRGIAGRLDSAGWSAATLVHPAATLGSEVDLGPGTVVCAGARLTTNIRLGRHVHVNPNATVGHDTTLGDFVSLNPSASISGDCVIESDALVGVQGVVLNRLRVRAGALVGAAACVTTDVAAATTVVGVPARPLTQGKRE
ncbi:acetyltransferase [Nocardioides lentus]|uniref:Acetyltransferase n=1 Tax=Nocardioides lentus TaxID=338077 RepID=A0ABP5AKA2_9ACTN